MNTTKHARYGAALRIYDDGGKTADRYTLVPPRWARLRGRNGAWPAFGCNAEPFHPMGIGMHCECVPGPHLGRRIAWSDLPPDVQRAARQCFGAYCPA